MKKRFLIFSIFLLIGLDKGVNIFAKNNLKEDFPLNRKKINLYIIGAWVEPTPEYKNQVQGFFLKKEGDAHSINMATLQYQRWEIKGDKLILTVKSIGNKISFIDKETYKIISINHDKLTLKKDNRIYLYKKQKNSTNSKVLK